MQILHNTQFKYLNMVVMWNLLKSISSMAQVEGYWDIKPTISKLAFPARGKFQVVLQDGRQITMPISAFPSIKKVPVRRRKNWYLMGGGFTWDECPEVIHVEQILGNYALYNHDA